jgi:hypothetical protein
MVHAARRHDAESLEHLATILGLRVGVLGAAAADARAMALG